MILISMLFSNSLFAQDASFDKYIQPRKAAVVTAHPLATREAVKILQKGGNAFDAAITAQWVLAVVYPEAGNLGGGGFLLAYTRTHKKLFIDYREKAPSAAHATMYLDEQGQVVPRLSVEGSRASGVPGTVDGLRLTHQYAKLPLSVLIQPAIDLAQQGFVLSQRQANTLNNYQSIFARNNMRPTAFIKSSPWKAGDTLIQPELAATLKRIQQNGWKEFYTGQTADLIVNHMKESGGIITYADLKAYEAKHRKVLCFKHDRYTILTAPLPSSGGLLLKQMLRLASYARKPDEQNPNVHTMIEAARRAYEDRAYYMGDADFVHVPLKKITAHTYLRKRMSSYDANRASSSDSLPLSPAPESEETTHLSILDETGNAVSVTTTLNSVYGSKTVVAGAGFLLNNEMDDFSIKPGVPNQFGATGGKANAIEPGKRMLSCMTPTIILEKKNPSLILGTPGGTTIPTNLFQTITGILLYNLPAKDVVQSAKFHHQWKPDTVYVEKHFSTQNINNLVLKGHAVQVREPIGRMELIRIHYSRPYRIEAIADERGDDCAGGY
jgi:gamma-glutamyltranspeptidase/glutathione hydrolase